MTDPELCTENETLSSYLFSDKNPTLKASNDSTSSKSSSMIIDEPEPTENIPQWRGASMDEIYRGLGIFGSPELPVVTPSKNHTVLFSLPISGCGPPRPYPSHQIDKWCQGYVYMPYSAHSLYPVGQEEGNRCQNRWKIIQESLLQNFISSYQLEAAILSYNHLYAHQWNFSALHHFFLEVLEEQEASAFFKTLLPKMVHLALQLPVLITGPIPLLKRHSNASISFSQLQVASLLANAFFCTFPRRNSGSPQSEYATYPRINFNRLFSALREDKPNRRQSVMEKLKCIFHYFRRVTTKAPEGVITIQRRYIPKHSCPRWDKINKKLLPLHITSKGTIETEGAGLLQVDFANKYVGGGVLRMGCVQEEIRFVICPELMVTMLVAEVLDDTEALIISGVERYSNYQGYSNHFKWAGNHVDETPQDSSGRRMTSVVAIDAFRFTQPAQQFVMSKIIRELNKAYVGFANPDLNRDNLPAVATGNWGCGAFRGNPKLKALLQLMAASAAGRSMVYFTFGDNNLRDEVAAMYSHLLKHNVDVAQLFTLLSQYRESSIRQSNFYGFLYDRTKGEPLLQYCDLQNKVRTKESTIKDTKLSQSSQINTNIQYFAASIKEEKRMENIKIENWLANINDEENADCNITGKETKQEEDFNEEHLTSTNYKNVEKEEIEKKRKCCLRKLWEDKAYVNPFSEKVHSVLDVLEAKETMVSIAGIDNNSRTQLIEQSASVLQTNNSRNDESISTSKGNKQNSPSKKGSQRKISDFFQRTS